MFESMLDKELTVTIVRVATLRETLGLKEVPPNGTAWHALIQEGLSVRSLASAAKALGLTEKSFAALLEINPRTLAARKKAKRLSAHESDLVYAIARAYVKLAGVRGADAAAAWMKAPSPELKGAIPLEFIRSRIGTEYVTTVIDRERAVHFAKQQPIISPSEDSEDEGDVED